MSISYKTSEMLAIWPCFLLILATFLWRMLGNATFRASGYNSDNAVGFSNIISYSNGKFQQLESIYGRFQPFFFAHVQNQHYTCFRSETCYHRHSHRH